MHAEYLPQDPAGRQHRGVEEIGEVVEHLGRALKAFGKVGRFGLDGRCPSTGTTNRAALRSEIADLRHALDAVDRDLELPPTPMAGNGRRQRETMQSALEQISDLAGNAPATPEVLQAILEVAQDALAEGEQAGAPWVTATADPVPI